MSMKRTQREQIFDYMEEHGSITPMEAFSELGITKLATRIGEMKECVPIVTETVVDRNRFGKVIHYCRYRIGKGEPV